MLNILKRGKFKINKQNIHSSGKMAEQGYKQYVRVGIKPDL